MLPTQIYLNIIRIPVARPTSTSVFPYVITAEILDVQFMDTMRRFGNCEHSENNIYTCNKNQRHE